MADEPLRDLSVHGRRVLPSDQSRGEKRFETVNYNLSHKVGNNSYYFRSGGAEYEVQDTGCRQVVGLEVSIALVSR